MNSLQHLNEVKIILNAFEDSGITAKFQLHWGLLATNIFEDHPVTLSTVEDLDSILDTLKFAPISSNETTRWLFQSAEKEYQAQGFHWTDTEPNFACTRSQTFWAIHSGVVGASVVDGMYVVELGNVVSIVWICCRFWETGDIFPQWCLWHKCDAAVFSDHMSRTVLVL